MCSIPPTHTRAHTGSHSWSKRGWTLLGHKNKERRRTKKKMATEHRPMTPSTQPTPSHSQYQYTHTTFYSSRTGGAQQSLKSSANPKTPRLSPHATNHSGSSSGYLQEKAWVRFQSFVLTKSILLLSSRPELTSNCWSEQPT